jgi:hypothetical protein
VSGWDLSFVIIWKSFLDSLSASPSMKEGKKKKKRKKKQKGKQSCPLKTDFIAGGERHNEH